MYMVQNIYKMLFELFGDRANVTQYIEKWHYDGDGNANFCACYEDRWMDVSETLHNIDGETLLKMAIDLGLETPDFIPCVPTFRNELKSCFETASQIFEKAFRNVDEDPSMAIGLANSALESIIKGILNRMNLNAEKDTLSQLAKVVFKQFESDYRDTFPTEIKVIASSLINICNRIEDLRSAKTEFHGKTDCDFMVKDPLIAYFVVNSASTVGLLLLSFYKSKYPIKTDVVSQDDLPF